MHYQKNKLWEIVRASLNHPANPGYATIYMDKFLLHRELGPCTELRNLTPTPTPPESESESQNQNFPESEPVSSKKKFRSRSRSQIEDFDSDSILNLHHEKWEIFFLLHSNNLTLYMLFNEQKSAAFSSIVEIRGKKHHKNAHNKKCHI
jgi:hypothetical protein